MQKGKAELSRKRAEAARAKARMADLGERARWTLAARLRRVYALAVSEGKHRAALAALHAEALLLGLYPR